MGYSILTVPYFGASVVLFSMGCLSFIFALYSYRKLRGVRNLSKNLSVGIFDKTFNVFDPFPGSRRECSSSSFLLALIPWLAWCGLVGLVAAIFELGLVFPLFVLSICAALMMFEEAYEIFHNTDVLTKAAKDNVGFGKGDFDGLALLKTVLPRLSAYYLLLSIVFFVSTATLSSIMPSAVFVFAQVFGAAVVFARNSAGFVMPFLVVLLFVFMALMVRTAFNNIRNKLLGLLPSVSLDYLGKQFELMGLWVVFNLHLLGRRTAPEPEQVPDSERKARATQRKLPTRAPFDATSDRRSVQADSQQARWNARPQQKHPQPAHTGTA
jgi:hypothetical protein